MCQWLVDKLAGKSKIVATVVLGSQERRPRRRVLSVKHSVLGKNPCPSAARINTTPDVALPVERTSHVDAG
jgi:hypothetical protein